MGMISCNNHISFQTTANRIGNSNHSWDPMKSVTAIHTNARRCRTASSFETGFASYIIGLSTFNCENPDAEQRLVSADDLVRQFVDWYTKERKQNRKYYIKTMNSRINRLHWACRSPDKCAHPFSGTHADFLILRAGFVSLSWGDIGLGLR